MQLGRLARPAAYIALAVLTIYGVWVFLSGDSESVLTFWEAQLTLLPILLLIACIDIGFELTSWMWVYSRFGIRAWNRDGFLSCLATRAGLLLPVQLNRLIRPDSMAKLGRGTYRECLMAEGATFVLDATSALALIVGMLAFLVHPVIAIPAAFVVTIIVLSMGAKVANLLSGTKLKQPPGFWLSWQTFMIVALQMGGWIAYGVGLWLIVGKLPPDIPLSETILYATVSSVVGAGTGIPGGLGATEGLLGISLRLMSVPQEHLFVAVGSFRLLTFWIWIPVGWLALTLVNRRGAK
ncbi:MAG: lysylphosphatidylglycerol synthase domain-containing protein, partial [Planctomycetota bacterium]